jgi:predicted HTH transcriptional regulator
MALTREQLEEITLRGSFDRLVGEVETDLFDTKGQPYLVDNDGGKRELAKDVSAFANLGGGFILIGVRTKPSTVHLGDEVEEIRPFAHILVNTSQ